MPRKTQIPEKFLDEFSRICQKGLTKWIKVVKNLSLDKPLYFFGRYFSINVEMKPIFALFLRYLSRLWRFFHHLINFPIYISFRDLKGFEILIFYWLKNSMPEKFHQNIRQILPQNIVRYFKPFLIVGFTTIATIISAVTS